MKEPFELEWLGGVAERRFRKLRPDVAALPWGTLDTTRYPLQLVERSRAWWTQTALSEYRAAVAFADLLRRLLEVKAPVEGLRA